MACYFVHHTRSLLFTSTLVDLKAGEVGGSARLEGAAMLDSRVVDGLTEGELGMMG
jgi:hypothetical protein